jgi:hypothetical protein
MVNITTHNHNFNKMVEKAIVYLVQAGISTGHNPKPFILHSIRVGLFLFQNNYSQEIVIAGILHDLLEDTDIRKEDIEKEFGMEVSDLVSANTFNIEIINKYDRDMNMLKRCKDGGKWALLIKATDILENSDYYELHQGDELSHRLLLRLKIFLEMSKEELANEQIWNILNQRFKEFVESSGINP